MRIGKGQPTQPYTMTINQGIYNIEQAISEKDLGVIFDHKFVIQRSYTTKAALANRNLGLIFKRFTWTKICFYVNINR